jgi:YMGG-like Gly-zipper
MLRTLAWSVLLLLLLALAMPATDVMAQSSAGRGAVGGAIIGGAVGGRRGAAIGAATGAVVGANRDRRRAHYYYWRHGRCWVRTHGRSHPVAARYCR